MNTNQIDNWKKNALLHILSALAKSEEIRKVLIFKGALILNHRLGTERMSLDIDSNLDLDFILLDKAEASVIGTHLNTK